jgi:hypothetical protein
VTKDRVYFAGGRQPGLSQWRLLQPAMASYRPRTMQLQPVQLQYVDFVTAVASDWPQTLRASSEDDSANALADTQANVQSVANIAGLDSAKNLLILILTEAEQAALNGNKLNDDKFTDKETQTQSQLAPAGDEQSRTP